MVGVSILSTRFGICLGRLGTLFGTVWGGSGLLLFGVFQYACSFVLLFNSVRFGFFEIWILGDCDFVILG